MEWHDTDKLLPGTQVRQVIVKGKLYIPVKEKYDLEGHEIGLILSYYAITSEFDGNFDEYISLENAYFSRLDIECQCCSENDQEMRKLFIKHINSIGCNIFTWKKFVDKKLISGCKGLIDLWAELT